MTLLGGVESLEQQTTEQAPAACLVWADGVVTVVIHATGERLARRRNADQADSRQPQT